MSSGFGENSKPKANSNEYRNNKFWDGIRSENQGVRMNKITEWSYDLPTQPGDYLCCLGDVETQENVSFERFHFNNGALRDKNYDLVSEYSSCFKYARLVYTSTELKGME